MGGPGRTGGSRSGPEIIAPNRSGGNEGARAPAAFRVRRFGFPVLPACAGDMGRPKPPPMETRPARSLALPVAQEFHGILVQDEAPRLRVALRVLGQDGPHPVPFLGPALSKALRPALGLRPVHALGISSTMRPVTSTMMATNSAVPPATARMAASTYSASRQTGFGCVSGWAVWFVPSFRLAPA